MAFHLVTDLYFLRLASYLTFVIQVFIIAEGIFLFVCSQDELGKREMISRIFKIFLKSVLYFFVKLITYFNVVYQPPSVVIPSSVFQLDSVDDQ